MVKVRCYREERKEIVSESSWDLNLGQSEYLLSLILSQYVSLWETNCWVCGLNILHAMAVYLSSSCFEHHYKYFVYLKISLSNMQFNMISMVKYAVR